MANSATAPSNLRVTISMGPPRRPLRTNRPLRVPTSSSACSSSVPAVRTCGRVAVSTAPPEIEGRTWILSPPDTFSSSVATSPFTKTFTCSRTRPTSSRIQPWSCGCSLWSRRMTSATVSPSTSSLERPPTMSRRGAQRFTTATAAVYRRERLRSDRRFAARREMRTHLVRVARLSTGAEGRESVGGLRDRGVGSARELGQPPRDLVHALPIPGLSHALDPALRTHHDDRGHHPDPVGVRDLVGREVRPRRERHPMLAGERVQLLRRILADAPAPAGVGALERLQLRPRHLAHGAGHLVEDQRGGAGAEVDVGNRRRVRTDSGWAWAHRRQRNRSPGYGRG